MNGAAVKLKDWTTGPETITLNPGVDGLELLIPGNDSISAGSPPIDPNLILGLNRGWRVRAVASVSGHEARAPTHTDPRPGVEIRWTGKTLSQRDQIIAWLRDSVRAFGPEGGQYGIDVDVDQAGGVGGVRTFRPVSPPTDTWVNMSGYEVRVRCEETF